MHGFIANTRYLNGSGRDQHETGPKTSSVAATVVAEFLSLVTSRRARIAGSSSSSASVRPSCSAMVLIFRLRRRMASRADEHERITCVYMLQGAFHESRWHRR